MKYTVYQMTRSYGDVFSNEIASFETEQEAYDYADNKDQQYAFNDMWHEVREE